jgi:uncharacterized protein (DUF1330 family)
MTNTTDRTIATSDTGAVPAFAVGLLSDVRVNEELFDYMEAVEATLHRFGGQWMSHGRTAETREGRLPGDIVIIGFPDLSSARAWYACAQQSRCGGPRRRSARRLLDAQHDPADAPRTRRVNHGA